jgi:uncharacterized protein
VNRWIVAPAVKAATFTAVAVALLFAAGPIVGTLAGLTGRSTIPGWLYSGVVCALLLAATALALRLDRSGLSAVGLAFSPQRAREFAFGFVLSALLFTAVALVRGMTVGATWSFAGAGAIPAAAAGLAVGLILFLPEELVFRGYGFQRLIQAAGVWPAILFSAALFGFYHLAGRPMWGMGAFFTVAMPAMGGVVFGWAAVRTRGLALPIGLHLGGNWVQASLLSFDPQSGALWSTLLTDSDRQLLYAPDVLPHVPFLLALLVAAVSVGVAFDGREQPV